MGEVRSIDSNETLSLKLKTRALLGMRPRKEEKEIKLRYVDLPNDLSYKVLRRKAEYWLESLHDQGPETSAHGPANRDKGKDEGPTKGQERAGDKGTITGNCWMCDQPETPRRSARRGRAAKVSQDRIKKKNRKAVL